MLISRDPLDDDDDDKEEYNDDDNGEDDDAKEDYEQEIMQNFHALVPII